MHFLRSAIILLPLIALAAAAPATQDNGLGLAGKPGSVKPEPQPSPVAPGTNPTKPETTAPKTSYFLTSTNIAADNSTAKLNIGGQGTIQALGAFDANSGVRWTHDELEVGYTAKVNKKNTLGGGYTINKDGISVGAGIGINGVGTSFSLKSGKDGKIFATVFGDKLKCVVNAQGTNATCTN
ncbi:unnamed protein product [Tilletia laevis]|uniref:Uncharacterized protein n=1 Tax=Tilletia laevis TaxID=157183 RepID=A0A9N8LFZ8_9BASI|nr:hypothetical protein CF328_g5076 [Tilletia controversa]CAD6889220.1 unnamed protein product [Tilletia caries]CAD6899899.1 unnamed protein product [Tilletia laevis]CAD6978519.1 unnamed protein product [Tilletia controversa]CAD7064148.1 unnamed protein product [Tilletia caries]